jgi:hypothetical protein
MVLPHQTSLAKRRLLYHYTSTEGLLGILSTGTLWATQIRFLNDSAEFTFARDLLVQEARHRSLRLKHPYVKKIIEREIRRVEHGHVPAYVVSFSERGNTLNQWRAYAPRDRVSIGFQRSALRKVNDFDLRRCLYLAQDIQTTAQRRFFDQVFKDQVQGWIDFASSIIRADLRTKRPSATHNQEHGIEVSQALIWAALCIKHRGFAEECEWRLIDNRDIGKVLAAGGDVLDAIRFRRGAYGVTPYLVATLPQRWKNAPLGIAEVIVGPTPNPEATITSIQDLLWATRRSRAAVTSCSIPYRAW